MRTNLLAQFRSDPDRALFLKYSLAPLYSPDQGIVGAVLTFHDDTLTRAWSTWSDFGLGVEPEAVFENFDQGLFIVNQRRRITAFNRMAQEVTGFRPEEALGRYC
jgi:PAS domain-containing protein